MAKKDLCSDFVKLGSERLNFINYIGWGRVIPGQGNSGTVLRAISDKKYFHQVKQSIWPNNYRNVVGRHPLHVPVALELWRVLW